MASDDRPSTSSTDAHYNDDTCSCDTHCNLAHTNTHSHSTPHHTCSMETTTQHTHTTRSWRRRRTRYEHWLFMLITTLTLHTVASSGVLSLSLTSYSIVPRPEVPPVHTLRVCMTHYQSKIDVRAPCTYGSRRTTAFAVDGSAKEWEWDFPFTFSWLGTFSVVLEAYTTDDDGHRLPNATLSNNVNRDDPEFQLATRKTLAVSEDWTSESVVVNGRNHSRAQFLINYRVTCSAHYYGANCTKSCVPRNTSVRHYDCDVDGDKVCHDGWTGRHCDKAICTSGCRHSCTVPYTCQCPFGYYGELCDRCRRYPGCQHGTCAQPFECDCRQGWGGLFCNQDLNYCTHHSPCANGATCSNTGAGHYTCTCRPGFTGTNCEVAIHDCQAMPCKNGGRCEMADETLEYTCTCSAGFTGGHCQVSAETCADRPCDNNGTCMANANDGGFVCLCPSGYTGDLCDVNVNECDSSPCDNGGSCVDLLDGYRCVCPIGFEGARCEADIDDCTEGACLNGGVCEDHVNSFKCRCMSGWTGSLCQTNIDDCLGRPCANGGTCNDRVNGYSCTCRSGFTGDVCGQTIDECDSRPCHNGGTCVDGVNSYECHCSACHTGVDCETRDEDCLHVLGLLHRLGNVTHAYPVAGAAQLDPLQTTLSVIRTLALVLVAFLVLAFVVLAGLLYRHMRKNGAARDIGEDMADGRRLYDRPPAYSPPAYEVRQNMANDERQTIASKCVYEYTKTTTGDDCASVKILSQPMGAIEPLRPLTARRPSSTSTNDRSKRDSGVSNEGSPEHHHHQRQSSSSTSPTHTPRVVSSTSRDSAISDTPLMSPSTSSTTTYATDV